MSRKIAFLIPVLLMLIAIVGVWFLVRSYDLGEVDEPDVIEQAETNSDIDTDIISKSDDVPILSPLHSDISSYETLLLTQESLENYLLLADLYLEAGMILKYRDTLERAYRLTKDASVAETLNGIVVNVDEENSIVYEEIQRLYRNLVVPEYQAEAAGMLMSPDWFNIMMPRLQEGLRNYYWQNPNTDGILFVTIGYDKDFDNMSYTKVWYTEKKSGNDEVIYMYKIGNAVQMVTTNIDGDQYNGEFTALLCVGDTGTVYKDTGTFDNGIIKGDFSSMAHSFGEPVDVFSLILSPDDLPFQEYTGKFDLNGVTSADKPDKIEDTKTAFAYDKSKSVYQFYVFDNDEDTQEKVFDYTFFGLDTFPKFEMYLPVPSIPLEGEVVVDLSKVQVRINDNAIEWYDGNLWHNMGAALEYIRKDPFYTAPDLIQKQVLGTDSNDDDDNKLLWFERRGIAKVPPKPVAKPKATPTPTPKPQAPSTPSTPSTPSGPNTGNDGQDIGWSPDLM